MKKIFALALLLLAAGSLPAFGYAVMLFDQTTGNVILPPNLSTPGNVPQITSQFSANGSSTNVYEIVNCGFPVLNNVPLTLSPLCSTNGMIVYTNTTANGTPIFLVFNDINFTGIFGTPYWTVATNFPMLPSSTSGSTPFAYCFNNNSSTLLGAGLWTVGGSGGLASAMQVFAAVPQINYRLFMFPALLSLGYSNSVIGFTGTTPTNLAPINNALPIFSDTNGLSDSSVRDVAHYAYTDNSGKLTYIMSWSHYGLGQGAGIATSPDDNNYTFRGYLNLSWSPNFSNQTCWSPKIFANATNGLNVVSLLGPTNVNGTPTNYFLTDLNPLTFTNASNTRLLSTTEVNIGGPAMVYNGSNYCFFSATGKIWTNAALTSAGWARMKDTGNASMVGGSVIQFNNLWYWFSTYLGVSYITSSNQLNWSSLVTLTNPAQDYASGDGTFAIQPGFLTASTIDYSKGFQLTGSGSQLTALSVSNLAPNSGNFTGSGSGLTNLAGMIGAVFFTNTTLNTIIYTTNSSSGIAVVTAWLGTNNLTSAAGWIQQNQIISYTWNLGATAVAVGQNYFQLGGQFSYGTSNRSSFVFRYTGPVTNPWVYFNYAATSIGAGTNPAIWLLTNAYGSPLVAAGNAPMLIMSGGPGSSIFTNNPNFSVLATAGELGALTISNPVASSLPSATMWGGLDQIVPHP